MRYEHDELATLAKKGELPLFMTDYYDNVRYLLEGYPESVRRPLFASALVGYVLPLICAFSIVLYWPNAEWTLLLGVALIAGFASVSQIVAFRYEKKHELITCFGSSLARIADFLQLEPSELVRLSDEGLHPLIHVAHGKMTELAGAILDLQERHKNDDPSTWQKQQQRLQGEMRLMYDEMKQFNLMPYDGYGAFFAKAKEARTLCSA